LSKIELLASNSVKKCWCGCLLLMW